MAPYAISFVHRPIDLPPQQTQPGAPGASSYRQGANGTYVQAQRADRYTTAGKGMTFNSLFPVNSTEDASDQPTDQLPPVEGWSIWEKMSWGASTPYHWLRQCSESSRRKDSEDILKFLKKSDIFKSRGAKQNIVTAPRTLEGLMKRDIQREFYWITTAQIGKLQGLILRELNKPMKSGISDETAVAEISLALFGN